MLLECPTENELRQWVTGELSLQDIDRMASHLESCASCSSRVSTLDHLSDPVINALRVPIQEDGREAAFHPGAVLGDYVLGEELGAGGMGRVFRATHVRMRREVALKVVSYRSTRLADAARRFAREVEVAAKLIHPNIAIAYDAREQDGIIYLILEYIGGKDLSRLVAEQGPLPVDMALDYIAQAARGLEYAHSRGIIHRDVKPANLMLSNEGVIKVLDMGLSRLRGSVEPAAAVSTEQPRSGGATEVTRVGDVLGTLDFVAPEQASRPAEADHRADIYSLGCTLFYLLTGRPPARRKTIADVAQQPQIAPLQEACPGASPQLQASYEQMVAHNPEDRFASMSEVVRALEPKSHKGWHARLVAAIVILVFLAGLGGVAWNHWKSNRIVASQPVNPAATALPATPSVPFDPAAAIRMQQQWSQAAHSPLTFENSIGMKLAFIPPGQDQPKPRQTLRVTRPYYIGACEVTIGQFRKFIKESGYSPTAERDGANLEVAPGKLELRHDLNFEHPGYPVTDNHPATFISHSDAMALCEWLSKRENRVYRLPTMQEWMWAAQAGTVPPALWDQSKPLTAYAWIVDNSGGKAQPVAQLAANPWGLFDVHGNVAEVCSDFGRDRHDTRMGVFNDPPGIGQGPGRVILGSTYMNGGVYHLGYGAPDWAFCTWGARILCEIENAPQLPADLNR